MKPRAQALLEALARLAFQALVVALVVLVLVVLIIVLGVAVFQLVLVQLVVAVVVEFHYFVVGRLSVVVVGVLVELGRSDGLRRHVRQLAAAYFNIEGTVGVGRADRARHLHRDDVVAEVEKVGEGARAVAHSCTVDRGA